MTFEYKPQGVCSRNLTFDIENGIVKNVKLIIEPSLDNDDVLSNIRIGVNDLYVNGNNIILIKIVISTIAKP